jgi:hypothetical protein
MTITLHLQEESMANWDDKLFAASCSSTDSSSNGNNQEQQGGPKATHRQQLPAGIDELRYILAVVRADLASPVYVVSALNRTSVVLRGQQANLIHPASATWHSSP